MSSDELLLKLLRKINSDPKISQRDLSEEFDTSLGKINYCLKALKNKGFIKITNFKSNNKIKYLYVLTPKGIVEKTKITMKFMRLKMKEYDELKAEINTKKYIIKMKENLKLQRIVMEVFGDVTTHVKCALNRTLDEVKTSLEK